MVQVIRSTTRLAAATARFVLHPMLFGLLAAVPVAIGYLAYQDWAYAPPAHRAPLEIGMSREIVLKGRKIGLPLDVIRTAECFTQSLFTLRQPDADDPSPDGREGVYLLGNANGALSGMGTHHLMLWLDMPRDVPADTWWYVVVKTESDCGAPGNKSVAEPNTSVLGRIYIASRP